MPKTDQTNKKVIAIYKLMEYLLDGREINKYDPILLEEFGCSYKTLERYLKDIEQNYHHIIKIKKSSKNYYKLIKASNVITEFLRLQDSNISGVFEWLKEESIYFKDLETETKVALEKISSLQKDTFLFRDYPFEEFKNPKTKEVFDELKTAVKNNEYRDIEFLYDNTISYIDAKCLKLIFVNHNWYLAIEDKNSNFSFLRISFIQNIRKTREYYFQKNINQKYIDFLKNFQNAMTLYGVEKQTARLNASARVAKYFRQDMKKFFSSQKYINENLDGSIEFTLEFTQSLEILPFIKKWLPDIKILSPKSLKDEFEKDMKKALAICYDTK
jgi:predicted DNA-binding transcriptional regulator YafY